MNRDPVNDFTGYAHDASERAIAAAKSRALFLASKSPDVRARAVFFECAITAAADAVIAFSAARMEPAR